MQDSWARMYLAYAEFFVRLMSSDEQITLRQPNSPLRVRAMLVHVQAHQRGCRSGGAQHCPVSLPLA